MFAVWKIKTNLFCILYTNFKIEDDEKAENRLWKKYLQLEQKSMQHY